MNEFGSESLFMVQFVDRYEFISYSYKTRNTILQFQNIQSEIMLRNEDENLADYLN